MLPIYTPLIDKKNLISKTINFYKTFISNDGPLFSIDKSNSLIPDNNKNYFEWRYEGPLFSYDKTSYTVNILDPEDRKILGRWCSNAVICREKIYMTQNLNETSQLGIDEKNFLDVFNTCREWISSQNFPKKQDLPRQKLILIRYTWPGHLMRAYSFSKLIAERFGMPHVDETYLSIHLAESKRELEVSHFEEGPYNKLCVPHLCMFGESFDDKKRLTWHRLAPNWSFHNQRFSIIFDSHSIDY